MRDAPKDARLPLGGRRLLVTGGATGIGRAIVLELARQGAAVAVADLQAPDAVIEEVRAGGGMAVGLRADVSQPQSVEAMVSGAIAGLGGLDGLVNNAGVYSSIVPRPFEEIDLADWKSLFDVNVFGLMACCRGAALPPARRRAHRQHHLGRALQRYSVHAALRGQQRRGVGHDPGPGA